MNDRMYICILLDSSGSMWSVEKAVRTSVGVFLELEREAPGTTVVDLYKFSNSSVPLLKHLDLKQYTGNALASYVCDDNTALYDAVCTSIDRLGRALSEECGSREHDKVLFVILTDGEDNASRKFTQSDVKRRIQSKQSRNGWHFHLLAGNMDAEGLGERLGISRECCMDFAVTREGIVAGCSRMSQLAREIRGR